MYARLEIVKQLSLTFEEVMLY